jgi:hypothetical protein
MNVRVAPGNRDRNARRAGVRQRKSPSPSAWTDGDTTDQIGRSREVRRAGPPDAEVTSAGGRARLDVGGASVGLGDSRLAASSSASVSSTDLFGEDVETRETDRAVEQGARVARGRHPEQAGSRRPRCPLDLQVGAREEDHDGGPRRVRQVHRQGVAAEDDRRALDERGVLRHRRPPDQHRRPSALRRRPVRRPRVLSRTPVTRTGQPRSPSSRATSPQRSAG